MKSEYNKSLNDRAAMSFDHTANIAFMKNLKNIHKDKGEMVFKTDRAKSDNT